MKRLQSCETCRHYFDDDDRGPCNGCPVGCGAFVLRRVLLSFALALLCASAYAAPVAREPIDAATFWQTMDIARIERVPISVAYWLQVEESGDRYTGTWGCATAVNNDEPGGWPSVGLYQPWMEPNNIGHLLEKYWYGRGETEVFDPKNPIHSAKLGLRYISDLHDQLGTWYRAACAYNAGASKVLSGEARTLAKYADTRAYARRIVNAREPKPEPSFDDLPEAFRAAALATWRLENQ
jgi:hypothetical protein